MSKIEGKYFKLKNIKNFELTSLKLNSFVKFFGNSGGMSLTFIIVTLSLKHGLFGVESHCPSSTRIKQTLFPQGLFY